MNSISDFLFNTPRRTLIIIAGLAVIVRLIFVFLNDPIPLPSHLNLDDVDYCTCAKMISEGQGFIDKHGVPTTTRFPVYPHFLGLIFLIFGYHTFAAFVVQAFVGGIMPILTYLIGREYFDEKVSLTTAAIAAFYPSYIVYSGRLMSENLFIPLVAILIYSTIRLYRNPGWKTAALVGFIVAFTSLCRGVTVPLMMLTPVFAFFFAQGKILSRLKVALVTVGVILLTLSPWVARNYIHFNKIFITSSSGGPVLWMCYFPVPAGDMFQMRRAYAYVDSVGRENAELEMFYEILTEDNIFGLDGAIGYYKDLFPDEEWPENEVEFNRKVLDLLKTELMAQPSIFFVKHIKEFLRFWHFVTDRGDYVIAYGLILPFFLGGLWILRRRWKDFWILGLFFVYVWIMETAFMAAARYRMPFEVIMIVIGSYAIWEFFRNVKPVYIPAGLTAILLTVNIYFSHNDNTFRQAIRAMVSSVGIPVAVENESFFPGLPQDSLKNAEEADSASGEVEEKR
ncbi:MAG: glycosyltransferase family 39 protein [FCB group bacterium]|nr:glycosyltransferase family 39 protein [FCB group bacterium]